MKGPMHVTAVPVCVRLPLGLCTEGVSFLLEDAGIMRPVSPKTTPPSIHSASIHSLIPYLFNRYYPSAYYM